MFVTIRLIRQLCSVEWIHRMRNYDRSYLRERDELRGENQRVLIRYEEPRNNFEITKPSEIAKRIPRITLYSSASRRSSITSAMGNGFVCILPGASDIRTILFDFFFLQIINFTCNDCVNSSSLTTIVVIVIVSRYRTLSRLHTDRNRRRYLLLFLVFNFFFFFRFLLSFHESFTRENVLTIPVYNLT